MSSSGLTLSRVRTEPQFPIDPFDLGKDLDESILIYVCLPGTVIPMRVLELESVESVKLKIQSYRGVMVRNQKLIWGGRELARSNSNIRDYGVADGNVMHLVLRVSDLQIINVKTACGKQYNLHVERDRNIGYVKKQIAKKSRDFVASDEQEVLYEGKQLEDHRLIDNICRNNDTILHLFVRKPAKVHTRSAGKHSELSIVAPQQKDRKDFEADEESNRIEYDAGQKDGGRGFDTDHKVLSTKPSNCFSLETLVINPKIKLPFVISSMVQEIFHGLESGKSPVRSLEGTGGAYFMHNSSGQKVAVFKPIDEEPLAVNNPQGLPMSSNGEGLKKGTKVSEGALREVAAFILDYPRSGARTSYREQSGYSGVPPTVMIKCLHSGFNHPNGATPKIGSLQMYMENDGSCEDMGPAAFPVEEVHKISVLDIRLANADRHGGNILLSKDEDGKTVLIPIDHGYCLPESFEDCTFEWLYWPQSRKPYSAEIVDYISSLDAEEDIKLLKSHGWDMPLECARTLRIATMLLKKGVERSLTAFDIGNIMCRETLTKESPLEEMVQEAEDAVLPGTSEALFLETLSCIMDHYLDRIARAKY